MKKHLSITLISLIMISSGCETVDLTYPGNNQDLDPQPPRGGIEWADEHKPEGDDEEGQLKENSAPGLTIGTLNATDPNPDDEFTYSISSQKMDGTAVNYFVLNSNSGVTNLELSYGSINFEALTGSKQVDVVILVSDDSPADLDGDFTVKIKVINVNETPYFTNLDQIPRYADEYVDYDSPRIEWTDTDEGDNPSLSDSNLPGWLSIDSEGNIGSSAPPESNDVGNHEFLLTITDDEIDVQEEINIEVRENLAPVFSNTNSIPSSIRVGCYDDNDDIIDLNWSDPNNSAPNFNGNDVVTFTHEGTESAEWLSFDNDDNGKLFCVRAPENGDAGVTSISVTLEDDRPSRPLTTEHSFDLELLANDAPEFNNLGNFPETMAPGDTLQFDVEWQDPNNDVINFNVTENWSWFSWDNSGNITAIPTSSHVGSYDIPFNISDGCYT
ncbi:MAG: cadherin repeat domain-containing protein, partial [Candidatus Marinimicrobia bacterium]|nr:cadherin repeat domain-containing protein [Candidatus Neomarinimicrobiota bacterium]